MKKEYLIVILAGLLIAYFVWKNKKEPEPAEVIRPGDKGDEVYGLQKALTLLSGVKLGNLGVYTNETLSAVQYYLKDSYHLLDYGNGYVDKQFASDLYQMMNNGKKD